jgi:predicted hotdog family 3-hydroxylacyl-ACP dehydratase
MPNCRATCRSADKKPHDNKMYLVGTVERWNDAKQAEERERVKHGVGVVKID